MKFKWSELRQSKKMKLQKENNSMDNRLTNEQLYMLNKKTNKVVLLAPNPVFLFNGKLNYCYTRALYINTDATSIDLIFKEAFSKIVESFDKEIGDVIFVLSHLACRVENEIDNNLERVVYKIRYAVAKGNFYE